MNEQKRQFIELAQEYGVLQFGSFRLKSGRMSPYFFNAALFDDGKAMQKLGEHYAQCILQEKIACQHLFGPAYKGIPLATCTSIALAGHNINVRLSFNRKEAKDHGEGGMIIGAPLQGEILMVDDVITAGTAFREAQRQIQYAGATLRAVIIALDRAEKGQGENSAIEEIRAQGIAVHSLIHFADLIVWLKSQKKYEEVTAMEDYAAQYAYKKLD